MAEIILEPEQEELLCTLVEASRNITRENREKFRAILDRLNCVVQHPGLRGGSIDVYIGDVETLADSGLLANFSKISQTLAVFDIHPQGFRYYEYLQQRVNNSTERVENAIRRFVS